MSYVKYREDDIKIINHRAQMRGDNIFHSPRTATRYYDCKYCHKLFTSKSDLFKHIKDIHNIVRPLIVINEKIVGDTAVLQYVNQAKIILYGYEDAIRVGSTTLHNVDTDEIDITNLLKDELSDHSDCKIFFNDICVTIELHPIQIENNPLIKSAIEEWQSEVSQGVPLNASLLSSFYGGDLTFVQGIYNYFLACTAGHYKASRYDDAFSLLSQFHDLTGIGKCVLKAIAFRRNWVESLRLLTDGETDIFSTASEYFSDQPSSFEYEDDPSANQLFVEEGTNTSLELITLFQKGKIQEAKERLIELGDIDDLNDMNLIEQLNLLKARIAVFEGNRNEASRHYEKLITPTFREEYRKFLLGNKASANERR